MKQIIEREEMIKIAGDYDVIVAGAGPSGIAAALAAAKNGAKTLLIESLGSVGGMSTTGLMSHFTGSVKSEIYQEIIDRAFEKNMYKNSWNCTIDPELLKNTYYEMLNEAGVEVLLYTFVYDTVMEKDTVVGIKTVSKSGKQAFMAKVVIDCTGDGDVAYRSGAEFLLGREDDNKMQPATLMFKVGGVDTERAVFLASFESKYETPRGELQALAKEHLPFPAGHVLLYKTTVPGVVTCNMTNCIDIDGTKAEDLTRAELVCRSQIEPIVDFLREYVPGYEECYIISAASLIGIRETRHFKGVKQINEKDILEARVFEDWVVRDAFFNFDVHNITGASLDKTGVQHEFKQKNGYTIPYGCMVPEKVDGLLLSGRNISGTHMAHSNFRAMPICVGIGEACGIAASVAIKKNIKLREVSAIDIQNIIRGD